MAGRADVHNKENEMSGWPSKTPMGIMQPGSANNPDNSYRLAAVVGAATIVALIICSVSLFI